MAPPAQPQPPQPPAAAAAQGDPGPPAVLGHQALGDGLSERRGDSVPRNSRTVFLPGALLAELVALSSDSDGVSGSGGVSRASSSAVGGVVHQLALSPALLLPDLVGALPTSTRYGFACAGFTNATVPAGLALGITGGDGGSGRVGAWLGGWPLDLAPLIPRLYGSSDLDVRSFSNIMQQTMMLAQQAGAVTAAGSSSHHRRALDSLAPAWQAAAGAGFRPTALLAGGAQLDLGSLAGDLQHAGGMQLLVMAAEDLPATAALVAHNGASVGAWRSWFPGQFEVWVPHIT